MPTISRTYVERLIQDVDEFYRTREKGTRTYNYVAALRLKALIALLYLSGRRVSELTGRTYCYGDGRPDDVYEGVGLKDFKEARVKEKPVLCMRYRVLKRGDFQSGLREHYAVVNLPLDDPLIKHLQEWLKYLRRTHQTDYARLFTFSRVRAYQLINMVDPKISLNWLRGHHTPGEK